MSKERRWIEFLNQREADRELKIQPVENCVVGRFVFVVLICSYINTQAGLSLSTLMYLVLYTAIYQYGW